MIGFQKTQAFFLRRDRWRGTICFAVGATLVLFKWAKLGMLVEVFGFANLFGDFFPYAVGFARRLPVVGPLLELPILRNV